MQSKQIWTHTPMNSQKKMGSNNCPFQLLKNIIVWTSKFIMGHSGTGDSWNVNFFLVVTQTTKLIKT
jgi:hypothetical protein